MLKRSNIVAAEEDLQAFYQDLEAHSLAAHWSRQGKPKTLGLGKSP